MSAPTPFEQWRDKYRMEYAAYRNTVDNWDGALTALDAAIARFKPTHLVAYVCEDMCSSHCGDSKTLCVGPNNTVPNLEAAFRTKLDMELASTIKWPREWCEVPEELRK